MIDIKELFDHLVLLWVDRDVILKKVTPINELNLHAERMDHRYSQSTEASIEERSPKYGYEHQEASRQVM